MRFSSSDYCRVQSWRLLPTHDGSTTSFIERSFSSSAHVAGFAGKSTRRGKVNTIIGMDPAGPLFNVNLPSERLASGDAEYVEGLSEDI